MRQFDFYIIVIKKHIHEIQLMYVSMYEILSTNC